MATLGGVLPPLPLSHLYQNPMNDQGNSGTFSTSSITNLFDAIKALESNDSSLLSLSLAYILQVSYEGSTDISNINLNQPIKEKEKDREKEREKDNLNTINFELYPKLFLNLLKLLNTINLLPYYIWGPSDEIIKYLKLNKKNNKNNNKKYLNYYKKILKYSKNHHNLLNYYDPLFYLNINNDTFFIPWEDEIQLPGQNDLQVKFLADHIDENSFLLIILNILRNFSFDLANEQIMAFNTTLLRHLVSVISASILSSELRTGGLSLSASSAQGSTECLHFAFDILTNISNKLDLSGRKRLLFYNFMEELPYFNTKKKELLREKYNEKMKLLEKKIKYQDEKKQILLNNIKNNNSIIGNENSSNDIDSTKITEDENDLKRVRNEIEPDIEDEIKDEKKKKFDEQDLDFNLIDDYSVDFLNEPLAGLDSFGTIEEYSEFTERKIEKEEEEFNPLPEEDFEYDSDDDEYTIYDHENQQRELTLLRYSWSMTEASSLQYFWAARGLINCLASLINHQTYINRNYVQRALELLLKLTSMSENSLFFMGLSSKILDSLASLFSIQYSKGESLLSDTQIVGSDSMGFNRPPYTLATFMQRSKSHLDRAIVQLNKLKSQAVTMTPIALGAPAFALSPFEELIDTQLRDLALEILVYLSKPIFPGQTGGNGSTNGPIQSVYSNPSSNSLLPCPFPCSCNPPCVHYYFCSTVVEGKNAIYPSLIIPTHGEPMRPCTCLQCPSTINLRRIGSMKGMIKNLVKISTVYGGISNVAMVPSNASQSKASQASILASVNQSNTTSSNSTQSDSTQSINNLNNSTSVAPPTTDINLIAPGASQRNEGHNHAVSLLRNLILIEEADNEVDYMRSDFIINACHDEPFSEMACILAPPSFVSGPGANLEDVEDSEEK